MWTGGAEHHTPKPVISGQSALPSVLQLLVFSVQKHFLLCEERKTHRLMKYSYLLESNGAMLNVLSQHSERIWFEFLNNVYNKTS